MLICFSGKYDIEHSEITSAKFSVRLPLSCYETNLRKRKLERKILDPLIKIILSLLYFTNQISNLRNNLKTKRYLR